MEDVGRMRGQACFSSPRDGLHAPVHGWCANRETKTCCRLGLVSPLFILRWQLCLRRDLDSRGAHRASHCSHFEVPGHRPCPAFVRGFSWKAGLNKVAFGDPVTWDVTEVVVGTGAPFGSQRFLR